LLPIFAANNWSLDKVKEVIADTKSGCSQGNVGLSPPFPFVDAWDCSWAKTCPRKFGKIS